ncbi:MAG: DUF3822 family protein [Bacteroidia bacterium]|nr:DUF3822 family protein [Bacteroidia bacterium]
MLTESYHIRHYTGHQFQASDKTCLSLFLTPYSFMYAVSVSGFNEVFELGHMDFNPASAMREEEKLAFFVRNFLLHKRSFEKVLVLVLTNEFTLLPLSFGNEQEAKDYLRFSNGELQGKHVFSHVINDFRFCYALDAEIRQFLERTFSAVFIRHAGAVNLSLFFNHRSFDGTSAALFVGEKIMELALRKKDQLVYYNVLNWSVAEDVLYYLMFAFEQYGFDPATIPLALAGEFPMDGEIAKLLKKYIQRIHPVVTGHPVKLHKELAQLPGHFYFSLLNQHTCEL